MHMQRSVARYTLSSCDCSSLRSRCSIETTEWIKLIFDTQITLGLPSDGQN